MEKLEKSSLSLGFVPLTDCAPLAAAKEKGFFAKYGLEVNLARENSWANIRDKVAVGLLDGAQMPAGMPIAMSLGIGPMARSMLTAFSLDLNGNAVTVSNSLFARMREADPEAALNPADSACALKKVIAAGQKAGHKPLTFAMVFPFAAHNYELRYWMAAAGIDPDKDVRLVVVPPPRMVESLREGLIDGYCVGEPWNSAAVQAGIGRVLISKYEIWNNSPEKVLGVTAQWAEQNPNTHQALLTALLEAAQWLDAPENRAEAAALLARGQYLKAPPDVISASMSGGFSGAENESPGEASDYHVFHRYAANFPWRSHAVWFITQMLRWGQINRPVNIKATAEAVYRPDLYQQAAQRLGISTPAQAYKTEGSHAAGWFLQEKEQSISMGADRFIDGGLFDPAAPLEYLDAFAVKQLRVEMRELAQKNGTAFPFVKTEDAASEPRLTG